MGLVSITRLTPGPGAMSGLRKWALISDVNRIHQGPWTSIGCRPGGPTDYLHIVETVTFSKFAATLAEQRPSAQYIAHDPG